MHGGLSTGPRTTEGLARMRVAKTTHGLRTGEAIRFRAYVAELKREARQLVEQV